MKALVIATFALCSLAATAQTLVPVLDGSGKPVMTDAGVQLTTHVDAIYSQF